ncbi:MAG: 50S ribosomal protein L4 [Patescibacteria group bacterium]
MKVKLYNQTGQVIGEIELDQRVFGVKPQAGLIEQAITTHLANRRQAIAHTKTRGEVRGGGKKPWRQKGTGRARQGSIRSPQWKGGGVIFGPRKNRNFALKMNLTAKRKALLMSLSDKAISDRLTVVDQLAWPAPKTKEFAQVLKSVPSQPKTLVILPTTNLMLVKAGRNIPGVSFIRADSLNTYDVVNAGQLLVLQPALDVIRSTYVK